MFMRPALLGLVFAATLTACPAVYGQFLQSHEANRLGLTESWRGQLMVRLESGKPADVILHTDNTRKRTFVDVMNGDQRLLRIPTDRLDRYGQPLGQEEAERLARIEILRLRRQGVEGEIQINETSSVYIYALGVDGSIQAMDAETGRTLWTTAVGNPRMRAHGLDANDRFVATRSGGDLHVLDAVSGELLATEPINGVAVAGPVIGNDRVYVFTTQGGVEGFLLEEMNRDPYIESAAGQAIARPVLTSDRNSIIWPTDRQFVYSMGVGLTPGVNFRIRTVGQVQSPISVGPEDRIFFSADSGQAYSLRASRTGDIVWRTSIGEPVYSQPFIAGTNVLIASVYNNLFCLNMEDGLLRWTEQALQVDRVLASSGGSAFARLQSGRLVRMNLETGAIEETASGMLVADAIQNRKTNRLYLLSDRGAIQCLRPIDSESPQRIIPEAAPQVETPELEPAEPPSAPTTPFGGPAPRAGGGDAFGTGGDVFGGGANPFGGGENPFGGGADAFGGGEIPFGTGDAEEASPLDGGAATDPFDADPF